MKQLLNFDNKNVPLPAPVEITCKYIGFKDGAECNSYFDLGIKPESGMNVIISMKVMQIASIPFEDSYIFGCNREVALYEPSGAFGARIRRTSGGSWIEPSYGGNFMDRCYELSFNKVYYCMFDQTSDPDEFKFRANDDFNALMNDESIRISYNTASDFANANFGLFTTKTETVDHGIYFTVPGIYINYIKVFDNTGTMVKHFKPDLLGTEPVLKEMVSNTYLHCIGDATQFECLEN